jgi:hypothetical protein
MNYPNLANQTTDLNQIVETRGTDPIETMRWLATNYRIVLLGEQHDYAGRFMAADLLEAAVKGGANCLCIEVHSIEQEKIDQFLVDGQFVDLPVSAGGGDEEPMQFQQPYVEMLLAARKLKMEIFAVDTDGASMDERDGIMANHISRILQRPNRRCLGVFGLLHLAKRPLIWEAPTLASALLGEFQDDLVTVSRAVPCEMDEYGVWSHLASVNRPLMLSAVDSPFGNIGHTCSEICLKGSDFDYLFFYPKSSVISHHIEAN